MKKRAYLTAAKIPCRHGLWLVARENKKDLPIFQKVLCLLVVIEFQKLNPTDFSVPSVDSAVTSWATTPSSVSWM